MEKRLQQNLFRRIIFLRQFCKKHIHTKVNVSKSDLVVDKKTETEDNDQPQKIELEIEVEEGNLGQKKDPH